VEITIRQLTILDNMMNLNKYINFTDEELGQIRMALIGNLEYNKLETTKKCKMTMLSDDKTKQLSNKIYKHFKNNIR
jgi:hypothetical protein